MNGRGVSHRGHTDADVGVFPMVCTMGRTRCASLGERFNLKARLFRDGFHETTLAKNVFYVKRVTLSVLPGKQKLVT